MIGNLLLRSVANKSNQPGVLNKNLTGFVSVAFVLLQKDANHNNTQRYLRLYDGKFKFCNFQVIHYAYFVSTY